MPTSLVLAFGNMQLGASVTSSRCLSSKVSIRGNGLISSPQRRNIMAVPNAFIIEAKQNSLRRQRTTEKARLYNKAHKSEIATRMKKVFTALEQFKTSPPSSEADLASVSPLMNEAYACLDKAVVKGVLHRNTAARRKARLAKARKMVLVEAGLYKPVEA